MMREPTLPLLGALLLASACGGGGAARPAAAATPTPIAAPSAPTRPAGPVGPVRERAQGLREAADLLDKAAAAQDTGNKNLAETLFSSAELLAGADALASLAPRFRDGAPPRVDTPTEKFDVAAAPQPKAVGSSDAEDDEDKVAPPKVVTGSLTGVLQVDGKLAAGSYGLVTLEPIGRKEKARTPKKRVMEQRGREYLPHMMAVSVGSTVEFPNFDAVFHNVFSTSQTKAFDLGLYKQGEARAVTFDREGIVRVGCNLHANMSAYIAVVAAPHFVVTDDSGKFEFKRLVPGKYRMKAWSERSTTPVTTEITIKPGANTVDAAVTGDAPDGPQPDKFGAPRG